MRILLFNEKYYGVKGFDPYINIANSVFAYRKGKGELGTVGLNKVNSLGRFFKEKLKVFYGVDT